MRKVLKIIMVLMITCLMFNACTDLEEKPYGVLSPESFFSSESDFEAAIIGVYQPLFGSYKGFDFWIPLAAGTGADDIGADNDVLGPYDRFTQTTSNRVNNENWEIFYKAITNANSIIGNIGKASGVSEQKIKEFESQARFLRAFSYFHLTQYFGEVPLITFKNQALTDVTGQSSVQDIYNFIIADLKFAETNLPPSFPERGRATQGAAKTLLAKVYLTMAGWPIEDPSAYALARNKAKEVMDSGLYSLERDFADLWVASKRFNNTESIFGFYGIATANWVPGSHLHKSSRPKSEGGWGDFFAEERFLNAFPEGYRKEVSFHTTFLDGSSYAANNPKQPFIAKFRDAGSACGPNESNCADDGEAANIVYRYAEVLLIYAEAANMAEGGPSPDALEAINKIRRRANNLDPNTPNTQVDLASGMSQSDFDDAVIAERAWELAFENKRWFDLVRKKMVVEVNSSLHPNVSVNNRWLPKPALQVQLTEGLNQNNGY